MLQFTSQSDFSEIYRIMQASFSDDEYRPYDEQLALFEEPEYWIYYMPAIGMERVGNHSTGNSHTARKPAACIVEFPVE